MELTEILRLVRRARWLVLAATLIGGLTGLVASVTATPMYTTTTQFFVSTRNAQSTSDIYQGSQFSQQRVTSYAQLVTGQQVAARVIERLELSETASDLSRRISADPLPDTVLINVSVTDESPERAQGIAQALGEDFPEFAAELESSEGGVASPVTVRVTETARLPRSPSSPKPLRNSGLGLLVGALAGAGLAVLRARLDQTLKDPDETGRLAGAPVIGTVLRDEALDKQHTIDRVPSTRTAEDYRQLRNNLQFLNVDEPPKVIMVTSALPSEGKTTAVVNLGLTLAYAGQRVTIVEADLRKPKVARYLRMVGGVGLTNILAGSADVDDVVQRHGNGDLSVIASGPTPPNPGELLSSSHMAALLEKLRGANDFVLIDAPPLLPVADSSGLAPYVDGVLISVRYGSTRKEQLQQAAATLERVGATTLGVILNIVPPKAELATAYGYGYGYQAGGPKHA